MALAPSPLTSLSEAQRAQAQERFTIIRPALEKEITQAEVARTHHISLRTVQRWIKNYRERGLTGLADPARTDKGTSRMFNVDCFCRRRQLSTGWLDDNENDVKRSR